MMEEEDIESLTENVEPLPSRSQKKSGKAKFWATISAFIILGSLTVVFATLWLQDKKESNESEPLIPPPEIMDMDDLLPATLTWTPSDAPAGQIISMTAKFETPEGVLIPPSRFIPHHTRYMHVVSFGADLDNYAHFHPFDTKTPVDRTGDSLLVNHTFTVPGKYMIGVDVQLPDGAIEKHVWLTATGTSQPLVPFSSSPPPPALPFVTVRSQTLTGPDSFPFAFSLSSLEVPAGTPNSYTITHNLSLPIVANANNYARFTFRDSSGQPVTDLGFFQNAALHMAVVREGLSYFKHLHGYLCTQLEEDDSDHTKDHYGPSACATLNFPLEGVYRVVFQTKRNFVDELITFSFFFNVQ